MTVWATTLTNAFDLFIRPLPNTEQSLILIPIFVINTALNYLVDSHKNSLRAYGLRWPAPVAAIWICRTIYRAMSGDVELNAAVELGVVVGSALLAGSGTDWSLWIEMRWRAWASIW